jgi:hypothetical protein
MQDEDMDARRKGADEDTAHDTAFSLSACALGIFM